MADLAAWRRAIAVHNAAKRNQRGHRPPPGITGIRAATRGGQMSDTTPEPQIDLGDDPDGDNTADNTADSDDAE